MRTCGYEGIRDAAESAAVAFHAVAESCRGTGTPLGTASALRTASVALAGMADEFTSLHDAITAAGR